MVLKLALLPASVLRKPNKDLNFPLRRQDLKLISDMTQTVAKVDGIGLAAPQIGKNLNLAIIFLEHAGLPAFPIINPRIIKTSKEQTEIEEGCLSLPGVFGKVSRPKKITFEFWDTQGNKRSITDDGWIARVAQHEIDHLGSRLICDKWSEVTKGSDLLAKYLPK